MKLKLLICFGLLVPNCTPERLKRIIKGTSVEDRPWPYTAIRYYGALATAHSTWFTFGKVWTVLKNEGYYGSVTCSGSLLTPAIFQTACHCVSSFDLSNTNNYIKPPIVNHHWEQRKVVYFGTSNRFGEKSMLTYNYVLTERFIIDSRCGGLGGEKAITHDFALIQIDSDWLHQDTSKFNWLEIDWAPQYTIKEITHFHVDALKQQLVCMVVGFGNFEDNNPASSDVLRIGWQILMQQYECVRRTGFIEKVFIFPDHFSWVCLAEFPKHLQPSSFGDSGGPLSCNDKYFGVLSGIIFNKDEKNRKRHTVSMYHPLIYNLFANSVNYRRALLDSIYRLKVTYQGNGGWQDLSGRDDGSQKLFRGFGHLVESKIPLVTSNGLSYLPNLCMLLSVSPINYL